MNNETFAKKLLIPYPQYEPDGYKEGIYRGDDYGLVYYITSQIIKHEFAGSDNKDSTFSTIATYLNEVYQISDDELKNMIRMEMINPIVAELTAPELQKILTYINGSELRNVLVQSKEYSSSEKKPSQISNFSHPSKSH